MSDAYDRLWQCQYCLRWFPTPSVTAWYTYADGDSVGATVDMPTPYPDALAEAVKTCADMLREAMVSGIVVQQGEDEDEG